MNTWKNLDLRFRSWGLVDSKLAQASAFFVALAVAKVVPDLLSMSVWWYVALAAACAVKPTADLFLGSTGAVRPIR